MQSGMDLVARGVLHSGDLVAVLAAEDGNFAVVFTYATGVKIPANGGIYTFPPGTACVTADGIDWETFNPLFGCEAVRWFGPEGSTRRADGGAG